MSPVIVRTLQLCHRRSMPPQRHRLLHLEYDEPHGRPRPTFFMVLLKIEDDGKASCTIPPRDLLRTPATYKGNGTTHGSTLSARPHKQRRCCFDTCSNFSSHSTVDLRFYAGSTGGVHSTSHGLTLCTCKLSVSGRDAVMMLSSYCSCGSFHPEFRGLPPQVMARWMSSDT